MPNDLSKEEWLSWREHPVTELFFETIAKRREGFIDILAYGDRGQREDDKLIGRISGFTDVMNTTFEDY